MFGIVGYRLPVTGRHLCTWLLCGTLPLACTRDEAEPSGQPPTPAAEQKHVLAKKSSDPDLPALGVKKQRVQPTALELAAATTPRPGQPVRFTAQPINAQGHRVVATIGEVRLQSEPAVEGAGTSKLTFPSEGRYQITAEADFPGGPALRGTLELFVDQTPPEVEIISPAPGSMLTLGKPIRVEVRAEDAIAGIAEVTLDGKSLTIGDDGRGTVDIDPNFGLNLLRLQAKDRAGNHSHTLRGFYAAQRYQPTTGGADKAAIVRGIQAYLGQDALDAGSRSHRNPRDLATVLELVLGGFQGSAIAGQSFPVKRSGFDGTVTLTDLRHGQASRNQGYPELKLEAVRGGLDMQATLRNVRIQSDIKGKALLTSIRMKSNISASSMTIRTKISVVMLGDKGVLVKTQKATVDLHGLDIDLSGNFSRLLNPLIDVFKQRIKTSLEQQIGRRLAASLDRPLGGAIQQMAVNQEFSVPGVHGSWPTRLRLHSTLGQLLIDRAQDGRKSGIEVAFESGVTGPVRLGRSIPGSPVRGNCKTQPAEPARLSGQAAFEVGLSLDLANQVLTSVWQGGGFRGIDLAIGDVELAGGLYRVNDLAVSIDLGLPPLLTDCGDDKKLQLQVGGVKGKISAEIGGEKFDVDLVLHVAAKGVATGSVNAKTGVREIGLSIEPAHLLEFEVVEVRVAGKPAPRERAEFVESALGLVSGRLLEVFQGTLASVPMPELPLEKLSPAVPRGASLKLDIRSVAPAKGEIRATGVVR